MAYPRLFRRLALGALAAGLIATAASAAPPPLPAEDQALADQAARYLANIDEVKGHFVQTDSNGATSQGALYIQRPGRARFAYDPPSSRLVVSDGASVSILDPRLQTFDRYPIGATPLALVLTRDVQASKGVLISDVIRQGDTFSLTARDAHHPRAGSVTLTFVGDPIRLTEWDLTNQQGQMTRVQITDLEPTSGLDPSLFVLRDPRAAHDQQP